MATPMDSLVNFSTIEEISSDNEEKSSNKGEKSPKRKSFCSKLIGIVLFCVMLFLTSFSKISLVNLTNQLRLLTYNDSNTTEDDDSDYFEQVLNNPDNKDTEILNKTVAVYWYILLVLMIPNLVTFIRSFVIGVICKSTEKYPWPHILLLLFEGTAALFEAWMVSIFVFLFMTNLPPGIILLLLHGIGLVQASANMLSIIISWNSDKKKKKEKIINCIKNECTLSKIRDILCNNSINRLIRNKGKEFYHSLSPPYCTCVSNLNDYKYESLSNAEESIDSETTKKQPSDKLLTWKSGCYCLWWRAGFCAFFFFSSLFFVSFLTSLWISKYNSDQEPLQEETIRELVARVVFIMLILALILTQELHQPMLSLVSGKNNYDSTTHRYKTSFLKSAIRLITYPFSTYVIFRFNTTHKIDPWCLNSECTIDLQGPILPILLIQIFATLCAYITAWIGSAMTLRRPILIALFLSTPLILLTYYLSANGNQEVAPFFFLNITKYNGIDFLSNPLQIFAFVLGLILWLSVTIPIIIGLCGTSKKILAGDADMFFSPSYDSVFFEQQLLLNMKKEYETTLDSTSNNETTSDSTSNNETISDSTSNNLNYYVFICSTMYQESKKEMKELLKSLQDFADFVKLNAITLYEYQSHIVLDNGVVSVVKNISGRDQTVYFKGKFAAQLLSLLVDEFHLIEEDASVVKTAYGWCYHWNSLSTIEAESKIKFSISVHLKDPTQVKSKKRWSQVMYMKYILNLKKIDLQNSFILTTDADIGFKADAVHCLLDRMKSNDQIGAVCGHTHPKGSGALYWFQKFDYAIGHWFQKPTEDLLGCVLCCPGCFSMFRCSALKEVLEEYSGSATNGYEFLMKNMGEDRWLTTLLIERGYLIVYCALSNISTYCPESFQQFFSQRRRWIPSTIVNLLTLIFKASSITKNSNYISILFILFQAINIFSTAIAPATVVFVISTGLQSAYSLSDPVNIVIILSLIFIGIVYGLVCLFGSERTKIDVAKILTFVFVLLMVLVIVGLLKELVHSIVPDPSTNFLKPSNCTVFESNTTQYEQCELVAKYLNSLPYMYSGNSLPLPISPNLLYLGIFAFIFAATAILHLSEATDLFYSLVFFLALPVGYFLLPIYSTANIHNQGWGTREKRDEKDEGLLGLWNKLKSSCALCRCQKNDPVSKAEEGREDARDQKRDKPDTDHKEPLAEQNTESLIAVKIKNFYANSKSMKDIEFDGESDSNKVEDMQKSLRQLRNSSLGVLFFVNIMWFLLLYTVEIGELGIYINEKRAFQLLFLSVYAFIMLVQFCVMLCHRLVTLVHYINSD